MCVITFKGSLFSVVTHWEKGGIFVLQELECRQYIFEHFFVGGGGAIVRRMELILNE